MGKAMNRHQINLRGKGPRKAGFTLIEIMIVVIILGILAAIAIPQFSSASGEARLSTMRDILRFMRSQITVYKAQHQDVPPGYVYVGTWHAHVPYIDSLDGHIATIRKNPSIAIWTSYQGYVVVQFWDPSLNHGRGGVHAPLNICPENRTCVPSP